MAADLSSKTFHSRAKECLVGFKMRNCGRGAQKDSMALRTRLKSTTGGDTMIPEEEKLSRQTILESSFSSFQKAVEQAEDGKNKRRQETSGPYKTKADNQKEEHRKKIAKHLKFDFNTAQELSPAQEEEEAVPYFLPLSTLAHQHLAVVNIQRRRCGLSHVRNAQERQLRSSQKYQNVHRTHQMPPLEQVFAMPQ